MNNTSVIMTPSSEQAIKEFMDGIKGGQFFVILNYKAKSGRVSNQFLQMTGKDNGLYGRYKAKDTVTVQNALQAFEYVWGEVNGVRTIVASRIIGEVPTALHEIVGYRNRKIEEGSATANNGWGNFKSARCTKGVEVQKAKDVYHFDGTKFTRSTFVKIEEEISEGITGETWKRLPSNNEDADVTLDVHIALAKHEKTLVDPDQSRVANYESEGRGIDSLGDKYTLYLRNVFVKDAPLSRDADGNPICEGKPKCSGIPVTLQYAISKALGLRYSDFRSYILDADKFKGIVADGLCLCFGDVGEVDICLPEQMNEFFEQQQDYVPEPEGEPAMV